jgi:membrane dipeptidase
MIEYAGSEVALVDGHLFWDNHSCMPLRPLDESFLPQLERYRRANVQVVTLNIGFGEQTIEQHLRMIAQFRRWVSLRTDAYRLVRSVADIEQAVRERKLAITFDIEGAGAIGDQLSLISAYYDLGVRWMLMAYNRGNLVGAGCHDAEDKGLTKFGRYVVEEMERVGMVACCSHTGRRTSLDVMACSHNPVIFSHSNPKALCDHPRNIDDELMRACAATGGVVGINGVGLFLGNNDVRTENLVRSIEYAVSLIGVDHVGIGLDYVFDQVELKEMLASMRNSFPVGSGYDSVPAFATPEQLPEIAQALSRLGYPEVDIAKIMGGNHLRVARRVWK